MIKCNLLIDWSWFLRSAELMPDTGWEN